MGQGQRTHPLGESGWTRRPPPAAGPCTTEHRQCISRAHPHTPTRVHRSTPHAHIPGTWVHTTPCQSHIFRSQVPTYIYAHLHVCTPVCLHSAVHVYTHTYLVVRTCTRVHIHMPTEIQACAYSLIGMHTEIHASMCTSTVYTCVHTCPRSAPSIWGLGAVDRLVPTLHPLSGTEARTTQGSHTCTPSLLAQVPAMLPLTALLEGSLTGRSSQEVHWREACMAPSVDSGVQAGTPGSRNGGQGLRAEWWWVVAHGASWVQGHRKGGLSIQGVGVLGARVPGDADIHQCLKPVSQNDIFTT